MCIYIQVYTSMCVWCVVNSCVYVVVYVCICVLYYTAKIGRKYHKVERGISGHSSESTILLEESS